MYGLFSCKKTTLATEPTETLNLFCKESREKVLSVQFEQFSEMQYNNMINNRSVFLVPHYSDFVNTENRTMHCDMLLPGSLCSFAPCLCCLPKLCDGVFAYVCVDLQCLV